MFFNGKFVWILFIDFLRFRSDSSIEIINVAAFFNEKPDDEKALRGAELAVEHLNRWSEDLFDGRYKINLFVNNSQCDPVFAVDAFFHAIFRRPKIFFLLGTSCSNETKSIVQVAQHYNLILFSHSTSFISQLDQNDSMLVRLSVSDENHNDARIAWIQHNNWSNVAILHQDSTDFSLMSAQLAKRLNQSKINVVLTQSASLTNLTSALRTLQVKNVRIVFVHFDSWSRAHFFCEVFRNFAKNVRERFVWILTEFDFPSWKFEAKNCSKEEILSAAENHFIVESSFDKNSNFLHPKMFEIFRTSNLTSRKSINAFDAVLAIGALIRSSIEQKIPIERFSYGSTEIRDRWTEILDRIHFHGFSEPVAFNKGKRRARTLIQQFQIEQNQIVLTTVAQFSHEKQLETNCSICRSLRWTIPSKSGDRRFPVDLVPVDIQRVVTRRLTINSVETIFIVAFSLSALALAIFFLIFNIVHRHQRFIKLSSPKLNNVMLFGAMHIHVACLLFAVDRWFLERNFLRIVCILRIFLFAGGFSLTFGSMFLKTLRVHRIFTSRNRPLLHSKLLQDQHLLSICFCLYAIDIVFALIWNYFDPHSAQFAYEPIRPLNVDLVVRNEIYFCHSRYRHKILPLLYLYKSLFLVAGGYLAAKTRHVHIPALNDSKFIVWSIYVVVLTTLFTAVLMVLIKHSQFLLLICFFIILMTSSILCLVFLPKVFRLRQRHETLHQVVSRDLVVDESRTRRLAVEISFFEKYRYAQLQNRELKSELVRLSHIADALETKFNSNTSNVALVLLPFAVRWASNFLQKADGSTALNSGNRQASKPMIDYSRATIEEETIEHTSMSSENVTEKLVAPVPMTPTSINLTGKSISDLSSLALSHLITEERNASEISLNRTMTDDESILVADSEIDP